MLKIDDTWHVRARNNLVPATPMAVLGGSTSCRFLPAKSMIPCAEGN